jgi:hypothetical protein
MIHTTIQPLFHLFQFIHILTDETCIPSQSHGEAAIECWYMDGSQNYIQTLFTSSPLMISMSLWSMYPYWNDPLQKRRFPLLKSTLNLKYSGGCGKVHTLFLQGL